MNCSAVKHSKIIHHLFKRACVKLAGTKGNYYASHMAMFLLSTKSLNSVGGDHKNTVYLLLSCQSDCV